MEREAAQAGGICVGPLSAADSSTVLPALSEWLGAMGLAAHVVMTQVVKTEGGIPATSQPPGKLWHLTLRPEAAALWAPAHDTLGLGDQLDQSLGFARNDAQRLDREILAALMASPVSQAFPSVDELVSAVRIRRYTAQSGALTAMDFHTSKVARPMQWWSYDEDRGFTLKPEADLVEALRFTTQPDLSGELYAFSCYRATEYVCLLGIATELMQTNPPLYEALQAHWRESAIASGKFHDTFLHEFGSNEDPLPPRFYVPGDRVWFRNPDEASSDASGYEGSWTMYLGGGHFANMWKRNQPFTLRTKCVEIYHWRHATYQDAQGDLRIDESIVERCVAETLSDPTRADAVVERMARLRDLRGIYSDGGCIDRTREGPRFVRPTTSDIPLLPPQAVPQEAVFKSTDVLTPIS